MRPSTAVMRERIIQATIHEIETHGITDFSIRRVAAECDVSCAAPYKHFKNKQTLILEVLRYVNTCWQEISSEILAKHADNYRAALVDICIAYIHFLCDNPGFFSIVLLSDHSLDEEQIREKGAISPISEDAVRKYCISVQMSDEVRMRKLYVVRSCIYGAAIMLSSGSLENTDVSYDLIRSCIEREFDLP